MWKLFLTRKPDGPQSGGASGAAAATDDGSTTAPVQNSQPAPSSAPASSAAPSSSSHQLHIDPKTSKSWQQLFLEEKARAGRLEQQLQEAQAQSGAQIQHLTNELQQRDEAIEQLNQNVARLTEQAARLPDLEQQINTLSQEAALGKKYQVAMQYPSLLSVQAQQEEDDEPVTNPVLALIESSNLEGDDLAEVLRQMSVALPQPSTTRTQQPPTAPPPAEPVQDDGLAHWEARVDELHQRMIGNPGDQGLFDEYMEATRKVAELKEAP